VSVAERGIGSCHEERARACALLEQAVPRGVRKSEERGGWTLRFRRVNLGVIVIGSLLVPLMAWNATDTRMPAWLAVGGVLCAFGALLEGFWSPTILHVSPAGIEPRGRGWLRGAIAACDVEQVFATSSARGPSWTALVATGEPWSMTYDVRWVDRSGRVRLVLAGLYRLEQAAWIARVATAQLGLREGPVAGEAAPRRVGVA
jgi:hypothetical protein